MFNLLVGKACTPIKGAQTAYIHNLTCTNITSV